MIERATDTGVDMAVHIMTQCRENYGAHDWDGVGQCPQYWKNKGGDDYVISIQYSGVNMFSLSITLANSSLFSARLILSDDVPYILTPAEES